MRRFALIFFALSLCLACDSGRPPDSYKAGIATSLPAPHYHQPQKWWRINHSSLVNSPWNRGGKPVAVLQWQECALCHDLRLSCDTCHEYLGLSTLLSKEPGE